MTLRDPADTRREAGPAVVEQEWVEQHVRRWRDADVIDAAAARRILAFESGGQREAPAGTERPSLLEALLYLGLAVGVVGVIVLTAQHWSDLRSWARVASFAVPGLLALVTGQALRRAEPPEVKRASGIAWMAGVALIAGAAGVVGAEAGWAPEDALLAAGAAAALLALILWAVHPTHPQMIALGGSLLGLAEATGSRSDQYPARIAGLLILAFAAEGLVLAEAGLLTPKTSARAVAASGFVVGPYQAGYFDTVSGMIPVQLLVLVTGLVLVSLSLRRASFTYMLIGVIGIFAGLVTFVLSHFAQQIGAPAVLILSGALLVAATLVLMNFRRFRAGAGA